MWQASPALLGSAHHPGGMRMTASRYVIAHPTDFSPASEGAFAHALKLALAMRAELRILHVHRPGRTGGGRDPGVRQTLARWGLIAPDAPREAVDRDLGVLVYKDDIRDHDPSSGVQHFLERNSADLLVLGSHGREGIDRVMHGSVSEKIAALADAPVLVVPADSDGFVDAATGALTLDRILVPVAIDPDPAPALGLLAPVIAGLGLAADRLDLVHVGPNPPEVKFGIRREALQVRSVEGSVVDAIVDASDGARLIVMPTKKRDSLLDALRGTNTERVMRQALCPVLAIPA